MNDHISVTCPDCLQRQLDLLVLLDITDTGDEWLPGSTTNAPAAAGGAAPRTASPPAPGTSARCASSTPETAAKPSPTNRKADQ